MYENKLSNPEYHYNNLTSRTMPAPNPRKKNFSNINRLNPNNNFGFRISDYDIDNNINEFDNNLDDILDNNNYLNNQNNYFNEQENNQNNYLDEAIIILI